MLRGWSKPIYMPATTSGVPPTNHTSFGPEVVPVLPNIGTPRSRSRCAVPRWTTPSSAERRVGKECVSTCRSRWLPYHYKTQLSVENTQKLQTINLKYKYC